MVKKTIHVHKSVPDLKVVGMFDTMHKGAEQTFKRVKVIRLLTHAKCGKHGNMTDEIINMGVDPIHTDNLTKEDVVHLLKSMVGRQVHKLVNVEREGSTFVIPTNVNRSIRIWDPYMHV